MKATSRAIAGKLALRSGRSIRSPWKTRAWAPFPLSVVACLSASDAMVASDRAVGCRDQRRGDISS